MTKFKFKNKKILKNIASNRRQPTTNKLGEAWFSRPKPWAGPIWWYLSQRLLDPSTYRPKGCRGWPSLASLGVGWIWPPLLLGS